MNSLRMLWADTVVAYSLAVLCLVAAVFGVRMFARAVIRLCRK